MLADGMSVASVKGMMMLVEEEIEARIERKDAGVAHDLKQELTLAAEMQSHLLKPTWPVAAKLGLAARSIPARVVGGDFYEFIQYVTMRTIAGAIGDVTGKGITAAIYGAMVTGIMRTLAHQEPGAAEMLRELNDVLLRRPVEGRFVSMIYATWNDRERRLQIANSGLPYPIFVRKGQISSVEVSGVPLGVFHDAEYEEVSWLCEPGDMVVFFTDGITEAEDENGEEFGRSRLAEVVALHTNDSARGGDERNLCTRREALTRNGTVRRPKSGCYPNIVILGKESGLAGLTENGYVSRTIHASGFLSQAAGKFFYLFFPK